MKPARPPEAGSVWVRITQPARSTLVYAWDGDANAMRVAGVHKPVADLAGDAGEVALGRDLASVPALVLGLGDLSAMPGALVAGAIVGGVRDADGRLALVVWASIRQGHPPEAIEGQRAALTRTLLSTAALALPLTWLDAAQATTALGEARIAARTAARERSAGQGDYDDATAGAERTPAWRVPEGIDRARARGDGIGIFDETPALLSFIPYRFQRYLTELLLADERVLFFAERPQTRERGGLLGLRRRRALASIVLVTDWRALWLEDAAPPDAALVSWGYTVSVAPLGRLVSVARDTSATTIRVTLHACGGQAPWEIELPDDLRAACAVAMDLLAGFAPIVAGADDRRVRRVLAVTPWQPDETTREHLRYLGGVIPERERVALEGAIGEATAGATILTQAAAPALGEFRSPATMLALTSDALWIASLDRRGGAVTVRRVATAAIATARMRHALTGCTLSVTIPTTGGVEQLTIPFHSPAIPSYRALFTRLCLLLHQPPTGQNPGG